ncbi:MAG: hypothetical protein IKQ18_03465 [Clostridia bacterium]|nr:hypothetical protein [Clostridia bacterium]
MKTYEQTYIKILERKRVYETARLKKIKLVCFIFSVTAIIASIILISLSFSLVLQMRDYTIVEENSPEISQTQNSVTSSTYNIGTVTTAYTSNFHTDTLDSDETITPSEESANNNTVSIVSEPSDTYSHSQPIVSEFSSVYIMFPYHNHGETIEIYQSFLEVDKHYYHVHIEVPEGIEFSNETDFYGKCNGYDPVDLRYDFRVSDAFIDGTIYFYVSFLNNESEKIFDYKNTKYQNSLSIINYNGYDFTMRNCDLSEVYDYAEQFIKRENSVTLDEKK